MCGCHVTRYAEKRERRRRTPSTVCVHAVLPCCRVATRVSSTLLIPFTTLLPSRSKVVTTNICGSDQHMVRGRTSLPGGHMVLGHEITGEVIELGDDCEFLEVGDVCSVPFNIACGRCAACKRGDTGVCLNVNPARPGAAYGYVDMGGWIGGQSEYVMVPYADFNLLKFPDRAQVRACTHYILRVLAKYSVVWRD